MTARRLAEKLEVSERTIYRDVVDLQLSGMPIEGEAGVGYTLRRDFDLPPLMFTRKEIAALVLGARMVQAWGGTELVSAAAGALARIEAVLPDDLRENLEEIFLYAPGHQVPETLRRKLDQLHAAIDQRRVTGLCYTREDGSASTRHVRPLGLYFWGGVWTLAAWCELRQDFRTFRVDRIDRITAGELRFATERKKSLQEYLRRVTPARAEKS